MEENADAKKPGWSIHRISTLVIWGHGLIVLPVVGGLFLLLSALQVPGWLVFGALVAVTVASSAVMRRVLRCPACEAYTLTGSGSIFLPSGWGAPLLCGGCDLDFTAHGFSSVVEKKPKKNLWQLLTGPGSVTR